VLPFMMKSMKCSVKSKEAHHNTLVTPWTMLEPD
jgi:hypothetical protein